MKTFLSELRGAVMVTLALAVVTCGLYPLAVWGIAQVAFRDKANGSLIVEHGVLRGSRLIAQAFIGEKYFHPRPSAAGANGYDATSSGGSNFGPTSQKLNDAIKDRIATYRTENGLKEGTPVPADAVTASASGLDPHISPANAELQIARVAKARNLPVAKVRELVAANTATADFSIFGDAGVNVLELNLTLDRL